MTSYFLDLFQSIVGLCARVGAFLRRQGEIALATETPFDGERMIQVAKTQNVLIVVHEGESRDKIMASGGRMLKLCRADLEHSRLRFENVYDDFDIIVVEKGILQNLSPVGLTHFARMLKWNAVWIDAPRQSFL